MEEKNSTAESLEELPPESASGKREKSQPEDSEEENDESLEESADEIAYEELELVTPGDEEIKLEEIDLEAVELEVSGAMESKEKAGGNGAAPKSGKQKYTPLNGVQVYLKHISKKPLLTRDQEKELGAKLLEARKKRDLLAGDKKKLKGFGHAQGKVEELEEEFINRNLRLVVFCARGFERKGKGMEFLELVQEGNLGLKHAAKKFDPARGYMFASYAVWWIRQAIGRAIQEKNKVIHLPVYLCDMHARYLRTVGELIRMNNVSMNYKPSPEEIARVMGLSVEKVKILANLPRAEISLDAPVKEEQGTGLKDFIPDNHMPAPDRGITMDSDKKYLYNLLQALSPREQFVIKQRFGINPASFREADEKTLEQIGNLMGVTRERIRQIEGKAMKKLRKAAGRIESERTRRLKSARLNRARRNDRAAAPDSTRQ